MMFLAFSLSWRWAGVSVIGNAAAVIDILAGGGDLTVGGMRLR